jgi:hypothetical protein
VVGPPIAIQPAAKTGDANVLQWALIAVVVILLAAVGFLLFERRKRPRSMQAPVVAPPSALADDEAIQAVAIQSEDDKVVHVEEPGPVAITMKEPPRLPIALPGAESRSSGKSDSGKIESSMISAGVLQKGDIRPSSSITEHRYFGIGLLAGLVTFFALITPVVGLGGLIPLVLAVYLLPSIIAFKVRHHYACALAAAINVVFGATVLAWLGIFVWALTDPRKSALDVMGQPSALGRQNSLDSPD